MNTLIALLPLLTPGCSIWHEQFKFAVIFERDGSWWTVDAHGSTAWKFPCSGPAEVLEVFGSTTVYDPGWQLR
jgi:hypothetical protein